MRAHRVLYYRSHAPGTDKRAKGAGQSGSGGWRRVRTTWNGNMAMPHGWAVAELWLLLRDCLVFENDEKLVLLCGVPPSWFTHKGGITIKNLPTHFGKLTLRWEPVPSRATLRLHGKANPPKGFVLRLAASLSPIVTVRGRSIPAITAGEFILPPETEQARIVLSR